jgi:myo-inositol 2-dehydrogenase / D-chiro-inositol 1-dehydrogenase
MTTYSGKRIKWANALASNHRLVPESKNLSWDCNPPLMPLADGSYAMPIPGKIRVV